MGAAVLEGDDRVLYEMADMVYHSLVLLAARGLTLDDLEAELRRLVKAVNEMLNNRVIP